MANSKIAVLEEEMRRLEDELRSYSNVADHQVAHIRASIERIKEQIEEEKNKKLKNLQKASAQVGDMIAQKNAKQMAQSNSGVHG